MPSRMLYRAVWIPSALICAGLGVSYARQPYAFPKPTAMTSYATKDNVISLQRPGNWKARVVRSTQGAATEVRFEPSKTVSFTVISDFMGSLMADITRSPDSGAAVGLIPGATPPPAAPQKTPLEKLHESGVSRLSETYPEYVEKKPQAGYLAGTAALWSAFTFKGEGASGTEEMTGERITALTGESAIHVTYYCPTKMEKQLQPTFMKMIASLRVGQNGGTR